MKASFLIWTSLMVAIPTAHAVDYRSCTYKGTVYSDGAVICNEYGGCQKCDDGTWIPY